MRLKKYSNDETSLGMRFISSSAPLMNVGSLNLQRKTFFLFPRTFLGFAHVSGTQVIYADQFNYLIAVLAQMSARLLKYR